MWHATGTASDGQIFDVLVHEIQPADSRDELLKEARAFLGPRHSHAVATLAHELTSEDPLPGIDGVDRWGKRAAELVGPPDFGGGLVYGPIGKAEDGQVISALSWVFLGDRTTAFHLPEVVIADISGLSQIEVDYEPRITLSPDDGPARFFFEWRVYLGTSTLIAEGETPLDEVGGPAGKLLRATLWLKGKVDAAILVGRVLCILGKEQKARRDPFFFGRLRHYEERYPLIAKTYPDLNQWLQSPNLHSSLARGPIIVFVHGTFSCS